MLVHDEGFPACTAAGQAGRDHHRHHHHHPCNVAKDVGDDNNGDSENEVDDKSKEQTN